jgi:hypothetical protein
MAINLNGTGSITGLTSISAPGISGVPVGSASAPAFSFTGDSNTGIYSPGADQVAISTNGTGRLFVDSSGRLLVGTSTARSNLYNSTITSPLQVEGTNDNNNSILIGINSATEAGGRLDFVKSRGATVGSNTIVANGDSLGTISFQGSDGSEFVPGAYIQGWVDGTPGANDMPGRLVFSTTADGASSPTERMRIDSSGRLLVGTSTAPSAGDGQFDLAVVQGNTTGPTGHGSISIQRGEAATSITSGEDIGYIKFNDSSGNSFAQIRCTADANAGSGDYPGRLVFSTTADGASSPTERMRIRADGIVAINRTGASPTSDAQQLFIGEGGANAFAIMVMQTGGNNGTSRDYIRFYNYSNQLAGSIQHNGFTTVSYNTSSDYRLKENISSVSSPCNRLLRLKPCSFNFIAEPDRRVDGFIAHEVQEVIPEAINGEKNAVDADGNPVYQGIDQSKLVPLLTAALQEAITKIETLEASNADLLARVSVLEQG